MSANSYLPDTPSFIVLNKIFEPIWSKHSKHQCYLNIVDVDLRLNKSESLSIRTTSKREALSELNNIGGLHPYTIRIILEDIPEKHVISDHIATKYHLRPEYIKYETRWEDFDSFENVSAVEAQWSNDIVWFPLFNILHTKGTKWLYQHPRRLGEVYERDAIGDVRLLVAYCAIPLSENQALVIISCKSIVPRGLKDSHVIRDSRKLLLDWFDKCALSLHRCMNEILLEDKDLSLDLSITRLLQGLYLQLIDTHLVTLSQYINAMATTSMLSSMDRQSLTYSTRSLLLKLLRMSSDMNDFNSFPAVLHGVAMTAVRVCEAENAQFDKRPIFKRLKTRIEINAESNKQISNMLSQDISQELERFRFMRDLDISEKGDLLAALASIFLPMSLASGILALQNRLTSLDSFVIYDYFGLVVLLGSLVFIVILLLKFQKWMDEVLLKMRLSAGIMQMNQFWWSRELPISATKRGSMASFSLLLIVSFTVGMFKDVHLGLKILGYGMATLAGALELLLLGFLVRKIVRTVPRSHRDEESAGPSERSTRSSQM